MILGVVSLLWPVAWAWFFRNDPREHPAITAAELATLPVRISRGAGTPSPGCASPGTFCR